MPDLPADLRRWLAAQPDADTLAQAWAAAEAPTAPGLAAARARLDARLDRVRREAPDRAADRMPARTARPARRWALALALVAGLAGGVAAWRSLPASADAARDVAHVALPDGTDVALSPGSRITWRRGFGRRDVTLAGEAVFDVAHDAERPFTVEAGPARVTVLGTRFAVRAWGGTGGDAGEASVVVERGRVRVDGAAGSAVDLTPGRRAIVSPEGRLIESPADVSAATAWQRAAFAVYDAPLGAIAVQVQRAFGTPVRLGPGVDPTERLTAILPRADDAHAVVADLAASLGYRVRPRDGGFDLIP